MKLGNGGMEEVKSFDDLVREQGGTITPWEPSMEFIRDFQAFMEESIRQSRLNHARAIEEARKIIIF